VALEISLAGRVSISSVHGLIGEERLHGRQGRLVFAYLVSEAGRPVTRDTLAEALWGEAPPAKWEKALGVLASKLRGLLGECGLDGAKVLTSAFGCYRLELPPGTSVDVVAAARAVDEAEAALAAGLPAAATAAATRAANVARLPFLRGENGVWVEEKRRELAGVLDRAVACLADASLQTGDAAAAVTWAREAIALEPFRESGHRRLMNAHVAAGNRAEALQAYERCRELLSEELGTYPSPETESIYRGLLDAPATGAGEHSDPVVEEAVPRNRLSSLRIVGAATAIAVVAAASVAVLLTNGDASTVTLGANAVGLIDPVSGRVDSEIQLGVAPTAVAADSAGVWVTSGDAGSVSLIDTGTNAVRQTITVGGGPAGLAVTRNAVWVANGLDGTVSRIDRQANRVVQTIAVGNGPTGVAAGEQAVWVTNSVDGTVSRIDPRTGRVTRTLPAVTGASAVAVGFHRLWIVSPATGSVVVIDPRSGDVLQQIGVGVDPDAVAVGASAIWVTNRADNTVSKIDPRAGAVQNTIEVGRGPEAIAAGPRGVWVANGADETLTHIDSSTGAAAPAVRLGNPPRGIAILPRGIYVAVRSTELAHRGGTLRVLRSSSIDSIDLALSSSEIWPILSMTNDGLVGFRRVGGIQGTQLVPDLAVALPTPTDGGRTYTFEVRQGVRYSTGKLVQPDDFRRGIERLFGIAGASNTYYYNGIIGADRCVAGRRCNLSRGIVNSRSGRTVTFHLTAPDADFLAKLALPLAFAVPAGAPRSDVGAHPTPATGPYRIAAFSKTGDTLRLVRNRRFREWSADAQPQGYPDAISFSWRLRTDSSAQLRAVERGAADVTLGGAPILSKPLLEALAIRYPDQLHMNAQLRTTYFFLNTRAAPFDDVRVRRAVNAAFDREAFTRLLGPGFAPTCRIVPPNFPGYRNGCVFGSGAVEGLAEGRRLVRRSGTAGAHVDVWMPRPIAEQGRFMVSVLRSLGYRARLKAVDPHVYFAKIEDSRVAAQTGYYTWVAGYPSTSDFIPPQFSCAAFRPASVGESGNISEFCDPTIDAKMARATSIQVHDPASATVLWQQVEQSILKRVPVVAAYNARNIDFVSTRVGNYQFNPQWWFLFDQAWVR
jgi:YVTN family beta-propeller protein